MNWNLAVNARTPLWMPIFQSVNQHLHERAWEEVLCSDETKVEVWHLLNLLDDETVTKTSLAMHSCIEMWTSGFGAVFLHKVEAKFVPLVLMKAAMYCEIWNENLLTSGKTIKMSCRVKDGSLSIALTQNTSNHVEVLEFWMSLIV